MKKIIYRIFVILTAVLLFSVLGSCYTPVSETQGGLEIMLPSRANDPMYTSPGQYYVRVYLIFNNTIYPLREDTLYLEAGITKEQRSITLDAIPAGTFRLCLGIGTKNDIGAFDVQYYSESDEFTLVAGSTVDVDCPYTPSPFVMAEGLLELNTKGIVYDSTTNDLFTATKNYVYRYSDAGLTSPTSKEYLGSSTINSITKGLYYQESGALPVDCLFLSTTTGISLGVPGTFNIIYDYSLLGLGSVNVLRTLAYADGLCVTLYFQRKGGIGGVYIDDTPSLCEWADVDHSNFIKGEFIRDFTVTSGLSPNYSFFTTAFGAFRLPTSVLSTYFGGSLQFLSLANFFKIVKNGKELSIISLGFDPDGPNTLFIGTNDGLYYATVGGAGAALAGTPVILPGTENNRITKIAINANYRAFASNSYLFLQEKPAGEVVQLPAVAGLPGNISGMAWYGADILVISGSEGLVAINVFDFFNEE